MRYSPHDNQFSGVAQTRYRSVNLSRTERWILHNQYQILEQLARMRNDEQDVEHCQQAQEAIGCGYQREYAEYAQGVLADTMDDAACKEVVDILEMFDNIRHTFSRLAPADQTGIDKHWTTFPGFDGNTESKQLGYVRHFCHDPKTFEHFSRAGNFDSHFNGGLELFRRMLKEWVKSVNKRDLTKEDLVRITNVK